MEEGEAEFPVLSLGSVAGGVGSRPRAWSEAVSRMSIQIRNFRVDVDSPLRVNVVFHISGEVVDIDFTGVRTGRYSKADRALMIQVAVPDEEPKNYEPVLLGLLDDALDEAARFARKKGLAEDLSELRSIVAQLKNSRSGAGAAAEGAGGGSPGVLPA